MNPNNEKEASFYSIKGDLALCFLCPHHCQIKNNGTGFCGCRSHLSGKLISRNYGVITSLSLDPIEKKPLYHFFPSQEILSAGTFGCNMKCSFCQNWRISRQTYPSGEYISPAELVNEALRRGSFALAYTYSEPIVWFEYVLEAAQLARKNNLKNVMVSNGLISEEPLQELAPFIDAWNIDLKAFKSSSYKTFGGDLECVKRTIKSLYGNTHVELTTLAVTDFNDTEDEFYDMARWIASVGKDIPWHISRYFPAYQYDKEPTSEEFLHKAYLIGKEFLDFVYLGNIASTEGQNTECPACGTIVIERKGYRIKLCSETNGSCSHCGRKIFIGEE